jgi:hypothetical protein
VRPAFQRRAASTSGIPSHRTPVLRRFRPGANCDYTAAVDAPTLVAVLTLMAALVILLVDDTALYGE